MLLYTSTPLHFRVEYCIFLLCYIYLAAVVTSYFVDLKKFKSTYNTIQKLNHPLVYTMSKINSTAAN